jgi:aspartate racemase
MGVETVGLLGTRYVMEQGFYRERLEDAGIEMIVPDESDRREVHHIIFEELVLGRIEDRSRETYRDIITRLVEKDAQAIVLGCTEIGLLVGDDDAPVPVLDTAVLHARAAVELALG